MGNCCVGSSTKKSRKERRPNPFAQGDYHTNLQILKNQPKARILDKYVLGRELGRGEFGITYLCTDKETQEIFACKSISKKKLRTAVDVEDVRREVAIMKHLPEHPHVVTLKGAYEDDNAVPPGYGAL